MNNIEKAQHVIDGMLDLYKKKNHDYGNAFSEGWDHHGLHQGAVYLENKWSRYQSLKDGEKAQVNEKIEDTIMDMANYAAMSLVEIGRCLWESAGEVLFTKPDMEYILTTCRDETDWEEAFDIDLEPEVDASVSLLSSYCYKYSESQVDGDLISDLMDILRYTICMVVELKH